MNFVKFFEKLFCRTLPSNHFSHVVFYFKQISKVCSLKSRWSSGKLRKGIHNPVQSFVVMEIRWKLHSQVVATNVLTYLKKPIWSRYSTYGENRWLICTSRNWKLFKREVLSKDAGPFLKISFFFSCFSHIFAIVNRLPGFSISRLANVLDFFNVNLFFECKYKCEYKRLFI